MLEPAQEVTFFGNPARTPRKPWAPKSRDRVWVGGAADGSDSP
jgi:hypothetical protein